MPLRAPPVRPDQMPAKRIRILHRAYLPDKISMLNLFASPIDPEADLNDDANYGVPFMVVLRACAILADNKPGKLFTYHSGTRTCKLLDGAVSPLVTPGEYAFQVNGKPANHRFPICRSFYDWVPPTAENLPEEWLFDQRDFDKGDPIPTGLSDVSGFLRVADRRCVMTGEDDRLDCVHLVPKTAATWFRYSSLNQEAGDAAHNTINSPNNCLLLRSDLSGRGLDRGDFCFVPYEDSWATIWLGLGSRCLAKEFNFRQIILPPRLRALYLYARFAWTIFQLAERFAMHPRLVYLDRGIDFRNRHDSYGPSEGGGGGKGPGRQGGKRGGQGGKGGENGGDGPAMHTRSTMKDASKRHATAQLAKQVKKRRRTTCDDIRPGSGKKKQATIAIPSHDNIPDISSIGPAYVARMRQLDQRLFTDPDFRKRSGRYPGFSQVIEAEYQYRLNHPAATDPGGARIALICERTE
ncbi:hypothetical protein K438DRAFT_1130379 [Mycena galopus ATCC 62051]|nr:hypothetical protein K438DRAFT_1130379 [Mycena galopus ATCC 62051]